MAETIPKKDLVLTRVFEAPVEQVWNAWTDSSYVMQWWGPIGFSCPLARMDVRVGGSSLVCMRSPAGQDMHNSWTYKTIQPHELLEFVMDWSDATGQRVDPVSMGLPPFMPRDVRHLITFKSLGDRKTEMCITEFGYTNDMVYNLSKAGLEQCLDKMAKALKGK